MVIRRQHLPKGMGVTFGNFIKRACALHSTRYAIAGYSLNDYTPFQTIEDSTDIAVDVTLKLAAMRYYIGKEHIAKMEEVKDAEGEPVYIASISTVGTTMTERDLAPYMDVYSGGATLFTTINPIHINFKLAVKKYSQNVSAELNSAICESSVNMAKFIWVNSNNLYPVNVSYAVTPNEDTEELAITFDGPAPVAAHLYDVVMESLNHVADIMEELRDKL